MKRAFFALSLGLLAGACSGSNDRDACERYLACVGAVDSSALPQLIATYGPDGNCWGSDGTSAACGNACRSELHDMALRYADEAAACRECSEDDHCVEPGRLGCHALTGMCVRCSTDEHCQAPPPGSDRVMPFPFVPDAGTTSSDGGTIQVVPTAARCHVTSGSCVQCVADVDCKDAARPHCKTPPASLLPDGLTPERPAGTGSSTAAVSVAPGTCAACVEDAHCGGDKPYCGAAGKCGACREDDHCSAPRPYCDQTAATCVQCTDAWQCDGSECVDNKCAMNCQQVYQCLQQSCAYGCADPNAVCDLVACPTAVTLAQCIATNCTACFTSGFDVDVDCQSCVYDQCYSATSNCSSSSCELY